MQEGENMQAVSHASVGSTACVDATTMEPGMESNSSEVDKAVPDEQLGKAGSLLAGDGQAGT